MQSRPDTIAFWRRRLPHWEVADGLYFVTVHVTGAVPAAAADRIRRTARSLRAMNGDDAVRLRRQVFGEMERWLDRAGSSQHLRDPSVAGVIREAIRCRSERGVWRVLEYVIMPSHLHLYVQMREGRLKSAMQDFKRWTGHAASRALGASESRFWQREWFDHWIRSGEEGERVRRYIRQNPVKAGLVADYRDWPYGSWGRACTSHPE